MNKLSTEKRTAVVRCLVEGNSIRATTRLTGVAKNTITKLLVELGEACARYQDATLRSLPCERIQCDEIWSFCRSKAKNVPAEHKGSPDWGDVWTWTAIDADSKLCASWLVGSRSAGDAHMFMEDLKERLAHRVQITTDGLHLYATAVETAFGIDVDYATLIKTFGSDPEDEKRYSPAVCTGVQVKALVGFPNPAHIDTSRIERQNLTMRLGVRRFTRLTNAFSRKVDNLAAAVALHFMYYNFARPHMSLKNPYPRTPAMAAGVADHVWRVEEIIALLDDPRQPA